MKVHSATRLVALTLVLVLALGSVTASAVTTVPRGPVLNNVAYVGSSGDSTVLTGMSESAVTTIVAGTAVPALKPLVVRAAGKVYSFDSKSAVTVNVGNMVDQAYRSDVDTLTAYNVIAAYSVRPSVVNAWVSKVAKAAYRPKKDAKRIVVKKRLKTVSEVVGRAVDRAATAKAITASLRAALASPTVAPRAVNATVKYYKPKVTRKNIGKAILVVLSERRVYLYKTSGLEKKYGCAIGMRGHETPTGRFKIIRKVKNPTWRNPAPNGWGSNMPAVIGPGPNNPLGMRALYLNVSGIRIHGTSKYWSIGRAASHGCMRMRHKDVADLYPRVPVGTPITIIK